MTTLRLQARAELQAAAGQPRKFHIDPAYSGGRLPGYTAKLDGDYVLDLATLKSRSDRLVANLDHRSDRRVGHVDQIENDGRTLKLSGVVSAATAAAGEFIDSAASGFPWSASIEAEFPRPERVSAGQTVTVNGQTFQGPIYVIRNAKLSGVAIVSTGADPTARALAASRKGNPRMETDPLVQQERDRIAQIEMLCDGDFGCQAGHVATLKAEALSGALPYEDLRQGVLKALRASRVPAGTINTQAAGREPDGQVLCAALCLKGGLTKPEDHFDERTLDYADRASRGVGLQSLLMQAACQAGYHAHPGEYINVGNVRNVLAAAFQPQLQASSGFSTLAISNVLANTANKFLLDGFAEMESPWRSIAAIKPVNNFKPHTFIRLLDSLEYEEVGPTGEIKHGTLADDTMTAQASTFAKMLTITRQDIINDDLGALTDVPRRLGRAAAQKFNSLFWSAFLASDSFWSAGNGNVLSGAGSALDEAGVGLTNALKAFRAQKSGTADGSKLIGGSPSVLLVPPALEIAARRLLNSSGFVSGSVTLPSGNPFANLAALVVADHLSVAAGITGGSDSVWYLLRAPSFAASMLVAALNGRVEPTVETAEADFNVLGVSMRGYSDVGVARGEKLAGIQAEGTA